MEVVVNWPRPKDEAEVRRFLGLASYYCKYIDKFADIAAPLHQLTQKDTPFQWTQKSEESFQRLKACLTEAPVLAYPNCQALTLDHTVVGLCFGEGATGIANHSLILLQDSSQPYVAGICLQYHSAGMLVKPFHSEQRPPHRD